MPINKPGYHKYPVKNQEPEKYLPSFFLDILIDSQMLKAEVRPLQKDKGYFTITLNGIFIGHIHKIGEKWLDFLGANREVYQCIGNMIEEHTKKTS